MNAVIGCMGSIKLLQRPGGGLFPRRFILYTERTDSLLSSLGTGDYLKIMNMILMILLSRFRPA